MKCLEERKNMKSRRKPKFERYGWRKKKKLSKSWRRPRGADNKMRLHIAAKGAMVKVGYRRKKAERGLHPLGVREVLVFNTNDLASLAKAGSGGARRGGAVECAARIASGVGRRKREQIEEEATALGIKMLNPKVAT